jgi:hypothetical protein
MAQSEPTIVEFSLDGTGRTQDRILVGRTNKDLSMSYIMAQEEEHRTGKYIVFYALDSKKQPITKLLKQSMEDGVLYLYKNIPPELGFHLDEFGCLRLDSYESEDFDFELEDDQ